MHTNEAETTSTYSLRLDSFLSKAGLCSRRKAKIYIEQGSITVNNTVCNDASYRVFPQRDRVLHNKQVYTLAEKKVYFVFHKPLKVESTNQVQREHSQRKTSRSFLQHICNGHLFSIGRLDYLSTGLLLFTNDGELCYKLTHPKFQVKKIYLVKTATPVSKSILDTWKRGIRINNILYTLHSYHEHHNNTVKLTLCEGKKREIRQVLEYFSLKVLMLHRTQFANITLNNLAVGDYRALTSKELHMLKKMVS